MPSGFRSLGEEDFDRVFIKETEIIDNFVGNRLWSWGRDQYGALGAGTNGVDRSSPGTTQGGGVNWKQVAGCYEQNGTSSINAAGVKTDGTLWTWGKNTIGQLGTGTTTARSSPGTTAGGGTNWKQVSLGGRTMFGSDTCMAAVKTDGTLWTWGDNGFGQLGDNTSTSRSSPGTVVGGGTNWKQVTISNRMSVAAIKTDGTLWTWGYNVSGILGTNDTLGRSSPGTTSGGGTNWKNISCGYDHCIAIKTDNTIWSWGSNSLYQLGTGSTTARSSPGSVTFATGANPLQGWRDIHAGQGSSFVIKDDGILRSWGSNNVGQLGDNTNTDRTSGVTPAGGGTNWKKVSAEFRSIGAIKTDGTLWTWGYNENGQLGNGNQTARSSPGTVLGNATWKSISSAGRGMYGIAD